MHNSMNGNSYELGINQFADWTPEEYKKLLGYKRSAKQALKADNVEILDTENL